MKLKPAGIKTIREAIERLMNGEVFYSPGGYEIIYDDVNTLCDTDQRSPFKVIRDDGQSEPINGLWEILNWQIEHKWEDDIGDGVLCCVSDSNRTPDARDFLLIITGYDKEEDYPYRTSYTGYKFATPLTLEEAKKYIKG